MHTAQQIIYSEVSHQHRKESQHHISMEEPGLPEDGKRWSVECRTLDYKGDHSPDFFRVPGQITPT